MRVRDSLTRVALLLAFALVGCSQPEAVVETEVDPTKSLPAKFKTQEYPPKPDFSKAAEDPKFQQAVKDAAQLLGAPPQTMRTAEGPEAKGCISFEVPQARIEAVLAQAHKDFLAQGFYLFRFDCKFGIGGDSDKVGLLPTTDKYAVMALMQTNGANYDISTTGVIAWMKELEAEQPFVLTGIGFDYMEGRFLTPVKDPQGLARRMYQFCPDIVDQGVGSLEELARELAKGNLYFWWD